MAGRRQQQSNTGVRARRGLGLFGAALAAATLSLALLPGGTASAAPTPNYHAGGDTATFTVTGVEDSNCLVSTGGTTVYIKPGDSIDFKTALAGVALGGLNLQGGSLAGLNVSATLDAGKSSRHAFSIAAGQTVKIAGLPAGDHALSWTATSAAVVIPALTLLGKVVTPAQRIELPLSSSALKSGAKLSWAGVVHVTKSAAQCKIGVSTPKADISAGPVHVSVPSLTVTVPGVTLPSSLPKVPDLNPTKSKKSSTPSAHKSSAPAAPSYKYTPPAETIPEQIVPRGNGDAVYGGNGGFRLGVAPDSSNGGLTDVAPHSGSSSTGAGSAGSTTSAVPEQASNGKHKTINLASTNGSPSGQLPVLLAILAVIALAIVAGVYARLYLLGRKVRS